MKQFLMTIPENKVPAFTIYAMQNEIKTSASWSVEDFFAVTKVKIICFAAQDKADILLASEWKQFLQPVNAA